MTVFFQEIHSSRTSATCFDIPLLTTGDLNGKFFFFFVCVCVCVWALGGGGSLVKRTKLYERVKRFSHS
jgi:hypothetical protein